MGDCVTPSRPEKLKWKSPGWSLLGKLVFLVKKGWGPLTIACCFVLIPNNGVFETVFIYQRAGYFTSEIQGFHVETGGKNTHSSGMVHQLVVMYVSVEHCAFSEWPASIRLFSKECFSCVFFLFFFKELTFYQDSRTFLPSFASPFILCFS